MEIDFSLSHMGKISVAGAGVEKARFPTGV